MSKYSKAQKIIWGPVLRAWGNVTKLDSAVFAEKAFNKVAFQGTGNLTKLLTKYRRRRSVIRRNVAHRW